MGVSLSVYVSETKWKKKKERKKGDVSATALANGWKKSGWKTPATPNSKCAIIQTYKCKNICMYSYIVRSANEYKCKKHHYDKQTHKKMQKPLSFWRPEKFIYTRIHNLFCFVDLFIIASTLHTHIVVWWACMCVHIGARQCLLRFATVIMMIALVSVQSASVCVVYVCVFQLPKSRVWTVKQEFWEQDSGQILLFNGVRRCCTQHSHKHTFIRQQTCIGVGKCFAADGCCKTTTKDEECRKLKWEVTGHGLHAASSRDRRTESPSCLALLLLLASAIWHSLIMYVHTYIYANTDVRTHTHTCKHLRIHTYVYFALFLSHI